MRLSTICFASIGLLCSVSLTTFAYEAPVVNADQQEQSDGVSTQAETTTGGGWQPMSKEGAGNSGASQNQNQGWQVAQSQQTPPKYSYAVVPAPAGSVNQRVARLEQQVTNMAQMNMPQEISDLQQKVAQLQGQVEADQHEITTLKKDQKLYYQDLSQQIAQNHGASSATASNDNAADNTVNAPKQKKFGVHKDDSQTNNDPQLTDMNAASPQESEATKLSDADAYGKAFRQLSGKHFNSAKTGFQQYLKDYPEGKFAVNAHFWLGEIAMMNQHFDVASRQFETVVSDYPKSDKVPDAKLKIAMIHAAMGKTNVARKEFGDIRKTYPGTTAAQLASIRLQQLANATSVTME